MITRTSDQGINTFNWRSYIYMNEKIKIKQKHFAAVTTKIDGNYTDA